MPQFWPPFPKKKSEGPLYDHTRLIDHQMREDYGLLNPRLHIICDIDKTYLETEFESLLKLAKTAFESAGEKITVEGASQVLFNARWANAGSPPNALHFVSSSPPQLRKVLEEKLIADGLDWSTDTFKNQIYNLIKGRVGQLRHHIAYKSAAILQIFSKVNKQAEFYLIGDNAESDAFIYLGVSLFVLKKFSAENYVKYLQIAGVEEEIARAIVATHPAFPPVNIRGILIRKAPGYGFDFTPPFTNPVSLFSDFLDAALIFFNDGVFSATTLQTIFRTFHNQFLYSRQQLAERIALFRTFMPAGSRLEQLTNLAATLNLPVILPDSVPEQQPHVFHLAPGFSELSAVAPEQLLQMAVAWQEKMATLRHPTK